MTGVSNIMGVEELKILLNTLEHCHFYLNNLEMKYIKVGYFALNVAQSIEFQSEINQIRNQLDHPQINFVGSLIGQYNVHHKTSPTLMQTQIRIPFTINTAITHSPYYGGRLNYPLGVLTGTRMSYWNYNYKIFEFYEDSKQILEREDLKKSVREKLLAIQTALECRQCFFYQELKNIILKLLTRYDLIHISDGTNKEEIILEDGRIRYIIRNGILRADEVKNLDPTIGRKNIIYSFIRK